MAFHCPDCGASARHRLTRVEEKEHGHPIYEIFYQCNNIHCGACFCTREEFFKFIKPRKKAKR